MALPPINVVDLFPVERAALLELLQGLTSEEWALPTVCPGWSVKDIALHLLGDDIGILSRGRDGFSSPHFADGLDIGRWEDLLVAIDRQNDQWVTATRRTSPRLLLRFLQITGDESADFFRDLDPFVLGDPVDWAGPDPAPAWMHVVREYTERWIHQQHIRDAVGMPGFTDRAEFHPVLDAFCRAIPHTLRDLQAEAGARVRLTITGEADGVWTALRSDQAWDLINPDDVPVDCDVTMDQDLAWRLFTKGVQLEEVTDRISIDGDRSLAAPLIRMVSILA